MKQDFRTEQSSFPEDIHFRNRKKTKGNTAAIMIYIKLVNVHVLYIYAVQPVWPFTGKSKWKLWHTVT